jgi:hypothetical protein
MKYLLVLSFICILILLTLYVLFIYPNYDQQSDSESYSDSDNCYKEGDNPFNDNCNKTSCCSGLSLCFNDNNFTCQKTCTDKTKPNCVKYRPSEKCRDSVFCRGGGNNSQYKIYKNWYGKDIQPTKDNDWNYYRHTKKRNICGSNKKTNDKTGSYVWYGNYPELFQKENNKLRINTGGFDPQNQNLIKSIRINTEETYNSGLFIAKIDHIPEGNGVWPSFWLTSVETGENVWACGGEIDIIEGVNSIDAKSSINVSTLHTSDKNGKTCMNGKTPCNSSSRPDLTGCGCNGESSCPDIGCPIISKIKDSFGHGYNANNPGSIYACELTDDGEVNIWFFRKGHDDSTIKDIDNGIINISNWNTKVAQFEKCKGQFEDLHLVFNTAICGYWAGNTYPKDHSKSPCEKCVSDMSSTNNNPLENAYWLIDYVKVYKKV